MRLLAVLTVLALAVALATEFPTVQPKDLAVVITAKGDHPVVLQVGPNVLYRSKHIPGALYAGPGGKPDGLDKLKEATAKLPQDGELVIYCGCCPWDRCPNIKPAMELLEKLGFTRVKAMYVPTSFAKDWIEAGYPVEQGEAAVAK